jgi:hypothetical protein
MFGMHRGTSDRLAVQRQFDPSTLEYTEIGRNVSGTMSLGTAYPGSFFAETTMLVTAGSKGRASVASFVSLVSIKRLAST